MLKSALTDTQETSIGKDMNNPTLTWKNQTSTKIKSGEKNVLTTCIPIMAF